MDEKLRKKLMYISKSKKKLFDTCPLAFKFSYIDKIEQAPNVYFEVGIEVHDFIEKFFNTVEIDDKMELVGLSRINFHANMPYVENVYSYKKNVARFEIQRWEKIKEAGFGSDFFFPVMNEKEFKINNPKLVGIVDRVHKCMKTDKFAYAHEDFKDGDLVIVENKTGKPTSNKIMGYEEDLLWYKIIIEIAHPELAPLKWGSIYFPYNNATHNFRLSQSACRTLAESIKKTRQQIQENIESGEWEAKPSPKNCKWCSFNKICSVAQIK